MTKKLRILHVCETANGGVGTYLRLLDSLDLPDVDSTFLVPSRHVDHVRDGGREPLTYPSTRRGLSTLWAMGKAAFAQLSQTRYDIVFLHSSFTLPLIPLLRKRFPHLKLIYCAHGWAARQYASGTVKSMIVKSIEPRLARFAHRVVCISDWEHAYAADNGYKINAVVIENAVIDTRPSHSDTTDPLRAATQSAPDDIHLLFVGRFDRQKGLDILLDAFDMASAQRGDMYLHLVGEAVRDKSTAATDALPKNVIAHGWKTVAEIDAFYSAATALVVPSRWEAFGLIVPEAFRNGTPVLVSDCDALPGLVQAGETGHVFTLEKGDIAALLCRLSKGHLSAMRPAARAAYVQRFAVPRFQSDIAALYHTLSSQEVA